MSSKLESDRKGLNAALEEARKGHLEAGIPIGSVLAIDRGGGDLEILGSGHNQRIQKGSAILHGEMAALEMAGRLKANVYQKSTLYTSLSMCVGAILLYKIPRVVIGENQNFMGDEALLRERGVEVVVLDDPECIGLMRQFIDENPNEWNEDIGES
ncbi:cytidine deaminase-like protein [Infundibulicybe gibba]|nr:cytidine deaminase-like protein [Infundibulicybe gibba]